MTAPALLLALAAAVALPRGEVTMALDGGLEEERTAAGERAQGSAQGVVSLEWFLRRVEEDATPTALQPFLQRASRLRLTVGSGALAGALGGHHQAVAAGLDLFVHRALALELGLGLVHRAAGGSRLLLPLTVGVALRLGDLRLAVAGEGLVEPGAPRFDLRLRVEVAGVVLQHVAFATGAAFDHRSVDAWLTAGYHPTARLGLHGGGFGGGSAGPRPFAAVDGALGASLAARRGHDPQGSDGGAHFGFLLGLTYRTTAGLALGLHYTPYFGSGEGAGRAGQRLLLTVGGRLY